VFFTHPGPGHHPHARVLDEVILTALSVVRIFAITEQFNEMAPQANAGALMIVSWWQSLVVGWGTWKPGR